MSTSVAAGFDLGLRSADLVPSDAIAIPLGKMRREGPITLDEASQARIALTKGVGIGYFMEADVREDIAAGRLMRIVEDWTPPHVPLCLYCYNRRNSSAAFQAFIALARDFAAGRLAHS